MDKKAFYKAVHITWTVLFSFILIAGAKTAFDFIVYSNTPISYWIHYESIHPVKRQYAHDERIVWQSNAIRFHRADIEWLDTLFCRYAPGEPEVIVLPPSASSVLDASPAYIGDPKSVKERNPKFDVRAGQWQWDGGQPDQPAECRLRANIKVKPMMGVEKVLTHWSIPVLVGDYVY